MRETRYEITFRGRVQGVGFRATTRSIARKHDVTGWVRNEPDGSVTCVAEGPENDLNAFLTSIRNRMANYIQHVEQSVRPATGEFHTFSIAS